MLTTANTFNLEFLLFLLACFGVTNILTISRLFAGARRKLAEASDWAGHWIRCPMCVGVPVGIAWRLAGLGWGVPTLPWPIDLFAAGAISSGWCWALYVVLQKLGQDQL